MDNQENDSSKEKKKQEEKEIGVKEEKKGKKKMKNPKEKKEKEKEIKKKENEEDEEKKQEERKDAYIQKKKEKLSKKLRHLGGVAFESRFSYDITKKYFIEDFNKVDKDLNFGLDFCHSKELDIEKIKVELLTKLSPNENDEFDQNQNKLNILNEFCINLNNYYNLTDTYNSIYYSSESYSSGYSSFDKKENKINTSKENKVNNKKPLSKLEFDLILKNISGEKIIFFLKEMKEKNRLLIFKEIKDLNEKKRYNICIELTVDSADIISKKIPQLYKTISCMNFLYQTNSNFQRNSDVISDSYGYFIKTTDFINYTLDLIILTISNGKYEKFKTIEEETTKFRNTMVDSPIKKLDDLNKNYNIYMIFFPQYKDEEIEKLNSKIEQQQKEMNELKKANDQQQKEMKSKIKYLEEKIEQLLNKEIDNIDKKIESKNFQ